MRLGEAQELALSYNNKFTNILRDDNIYIYAPTYYSHHGIFILLSIRQTIVPFNPHLFRFDSYNEVYPKPRDWYDLE